MEVNPLVLVGAGALITGVTNLIKPYWNVSPLWIAAGLAAVAGIGYASLVQAGYWEIVANFVAVAFPVSVTVFQIFKQASE